MDNIAMTPPAPAENGTGSQQDQQIRSSLPPKPFIASMSDLSATDSSVVNIDNPNNAHSVSQLTLVTTVNEDSQAVNPPVAFRDAKESNNPTTFNGGQKYSTSSGMNMSKGGEGMTRSAAGYGLKTPPSMGQAKGKNSFLFNQCWKIAVVCILILILIMVTLRLLPRFRDNSNVCLTHGCVSAASQMIDYMDETVPPCEDFFQFACGGFIRKNLIRDDRSSTSQFNIIQDDLNYKLRLLLEPQDPTAVVTSNSTSTDLQPAELAKAQNRPQFLQNVFDFYESCMDVAKIDSLEEKPLVELLDSLGSWPVVQAASSWPRAGFEYDWEQTLIELRKKGHKFATIYEVYVSADLQNNTIHKIYLDQPQFGLYDRKILLKGMKEPAVEAYYKLMVDMAVLLGADRERATEDMKQVLDFETRLATHALDKEDRRNYTALYNKMSLKELIQLAPNTNWFNLLNKLMVDFVPENEDVIVFTPNYVKKADEIVKQTDSRIVANYQLWRVVLNSINRLSAKYRERYQKFETVITGKKAEEPRWERCLKDIRHSKLAFALSHSYLKEHFNEQSKEKIMTMVNYIQDQFKEILKEIDWMDAATKQHALKKADSMSDIIAYPKELFDVDILSKYFEALKVKPGSYYENYYELERFDTDKNYEKLREPKIHNDWRSYGNVIEVNAYYHPLENAIVFPAGILQGVFFGANRPQYLNFGAIGFVIGHEITHGFDDKGSQFDEKGLQRNWWDKETEKKFIERKQCIIDQYGNFTVPENGMQINGINTQGENIADNGGIKEAFRAYREYVRDNGEEQRLPGLNDYTPEQLFWMSAAQTWCGKFRPEALKLHILTRVHSPNRFRVIGPLSNAPQFSESFGCPAGSPMNPPKRCSVW